MNVGPKYLKTLFQTFLTFQMSIMYSYYKKFNAYLLHKFILQRKSADFSALKILEFHYMAVYNILSHAL